MTSLPGKCTEERRESLFLNINPKSISHHCYPLFSALCRGAEDVPYLDVSL